MLHSKQWWYTNLTNYEFQCKILMQLSKNSYTNQGQTYQIFFIKTYYNMIFKMVFVFSFRKNRIIFLLSVGKYFEVV